mmetsp:Transcript_27131/g.108651  ORF Transcript_27131/g.108651 Transcript_27131/m.108651 type:complete len:218 (+) Transcript_27131:825-1478(+)
MRRCRASAPVQCGVHLKFSSLPTRKPKLASVRATAEAARRPSHHDDPGTTTVPESQEERRASPQSSHPHAQELVVYFIWMAALLRPASATVWSASGQSWRDGKPSRSSKRSAPACAASCANLNSAATRAVGSKRRCTLTGCPVALSTSRNWTRTPPESGSAGTSSASHGGGAEEEEEASVGGAAGGNGGSRTPPPAVVVVGGGGGGRPHGGDDDDDA